MRIEPAPPQLQLSYFRCQDCQTRFGANMLVHVPVEQWVAQALALSCPNCGKKRLSFGEGRTLGEDVESRIEGPLDARVANWLKNGETGSSSEAIVAHMLGRPSREMTAPSDLSDFRRCVLLLGHIQEWSARMHEMAIYEKWTRLAPQFAQVMNAYLEERPNLDGPAPLTGALLKDLI